ncbi:DUF1796 family putative cysteine peptidase [Methylorubrum podarium]|jgi:Putative papain-like cysteine peptidase (DUF1796)|uniref:DUF1796 family putative cysteine peptidase n=1 Tax=Methylorubrum podarium TaxID=200476 RepID=UPI001EE1F2E8|nr:DUF1796 family putative cysteine peptidase [Methylorubrum podarium]GJE71249.1 hypothetical protein CHKEEEPN_2793 [Methylorubrum podarium]
MHLADIQKSYDLIVSLGSACDPAAHLRQRGLRKYSMPFDWVVTNTIPIVSRVIANDYEEFMDFKNLTLDQGNAIFNDEDDGVNGEYSQKLKSYFVKDNKYDVLSVHDFPIVEGKAWDATYPIFRERLDRRVRRLRADLTQSKSILFIRWAGALADAVDLYSTLKSKTSGEANLLVLCPVDGASGVGPDISSVDGVCYVQVPNRPADDGLWDEVLKGISLRS